MERTLIATGIIERDPSNDLLPVWSYPTITRQVEAVAVSRSLLNQSGSFDAEEPQTIVSQFGDQWLYQRTVKATAKELSKITHFCVWILAKDFHPELYCAMTVVLAESYQAGGPISVLQAYLSVFARGSFGKFRVSDFDIQKSMLAGALKESISLFGESFILLWVAMLLKKKIAVYSDDQSQLLSFLRCLPLLVWHRRNFNVLCPLVQLVPNQLSDLQSRGGYCAGFIDDAIKTGQSGELYDVLVDLPGQALQVADKAKADLSMGEYHKNLGGFLAAAAAHPDANAADLVKGLATKTKQLFDKLNKLKAVDALNLAALEGQEGVSRSFARFLYNVAVTENMAEVE